MTLGSFSSCVLPLSGGRQILKCSRTGMILVNRWGKEYSRLFVGLAGQFLISLVTQQGCYGRFQFYEVLTSDSVRYGPY